MSILCKIASIFALVAGSALPAVALELPANDTVNSNVPIHISKIPDAMNWYSLSCSFRYVGKKADMSTFAGRENPGYYTDPIMPKNAAKPKWILEGNF